MTLILFICLFIYLYSIIYLFILMLFIHSFVHSLISCIFICSFVFIKFSYPCFNGKVNLMETFFILFLFYFIDAIFLLFSISLH